jgi:sugar-phosphatase
MIRLDCSAVIFDLDGVLVDSVALVEQQWRRWAAARGIRPEAVLQVCHGRRALETIRLAAPHLDAEAEAAALAGEECTDADLRALPGADRLLAQIPAGSWAVATSGPRAVAIGRLQTAGLPLPEALISADDVTHGKPHPEVYQRAAAALGLPPSECIVVEDSPAGIEAARAAGMIPIGLATTHLPGVLPTDMCVNSLADVHLGRVEFSDRERLRLELLVIEIARDRLPASFEQRRVPRVSFEREPQG